MNKFNSRTHKLSTTNESNSLDISSAIGKPIDRIKILHDGNGDSIGGAAINPGGVSDSVSASIASAYLGAIDKDPSRVTQTAQDLAGITLNPIRKDGRATQGSTIEIHPSKSLLVQNGPSLHEFSQIPLEYTDESGFDTSLYTGIKLKMDHFLSDPTLPTHIKNGKTFAAGHMEYPGFNERHNGEIIVWPHTQLGHVHSWMIDLLHRHISSGQYDESHMQSLIHGLGVISQAAEPKEMIGRGGKALGWEPFDKDSSMHSLRYPVPLHHAVEQVLGNIHDSPGIRLRKTGNDQADRFYQELWRSIPTARFGLDLSPMTFSCGSNTSRSLLFDQQHKMRALDSRRSDHDPLLGRIVNDVLLRPRSTTGLDLSSLAPRASLAAGNLDWSTHGAQATMEAHSIAQQRRKSDATRPSSFVFLGMENATPEFIARVNLLSGIGPGQDISGVGEDLAEIRKRDELREQYKGSWKKQPK
jgi:hypothetical protein